MIWIRSIYDHHFFLQRGSITVLWSYPFNLLYLFSSPYLVISVFRAPVPAYCFDITSALSAQTKIINKHSESIAKQKTILSPLPADLIAYNKSEKFSKSKGRNFRKNQRSETERELWSVTHQGRLTYRKSDQYYKEFGKKVWKTEIFAKFSKSKGSNFRKNQRSGTKRELDL